MEPILAHAISRCPFLGELARRNGPEYAKHIAVNPTVPVSSTVEDKAAGSRRPVLEDYDTYEATFRAFHGPRGVCPLSNRSPVPVQSGSPPVPACPRSAATSTLSGGVPELPQRQVRSSSNSISGIGQHPSVSSARVQGGPQVASLVEAAPFATLSLSFGRNLPDFGKMLASALKQQQPQAKPRTARKPPGNSSNSSSKASSRKPSSQGGGPSKSRGPSSRGTLQQKGSSSGTPSAGGGGQCPLRKLLGPVAPVVFNAKGHLQCPEPIIRARAMLAGTQPVRLLRPQALPAKLAAVGATSMAVNVPCGMWREHCEKFSGHWFLAVHASIPFIAMLRKAVIMPKYAILFSIATAIAGQTIGSRLERQRTAPLKPASLTTSSLPAPAAVVAPAPTTPSRITPHTSSDDSGGGASIPTLKVGCNSAQLAALEYFRGLEQGDSSRQCGGAATEHPQHPQHSHSEHIEHLPLCFVQTAGTRRAGVGGKCAKHTLLGTCSSKGWEAGTSGLTLVS